MLFLLGTAANVRKDFMRMRVFVISVVTDALCVVLKVVYFVIILLLLFTEMIANALINHY